MEYRELALESGIENWGRVPALGLSPPFISDLADAVIEALPSVQAITTTEVTSEGAEAGPMSYIIKIFIGSVLVFFLLLSSETFFYFQEPSVKSLGLVPSFFVTDIVIIVMII